MSRREHRYRIELDWHGNLGSGTSAYHAYSRAHEIRAAGKPALPGSSDAVFRGDAARYSPEELLIAALAACHMLWFLHLCAEAGVIVTGYRDQPGGVMIEDESGGGCFREVVLHPVVTLATAVAAAQLAALHDRAQALCFIARSVNFEVRCDARLELMAPDARAAASDGCAAAVGGGSGASDGAGDGQNGAPPRR